ncbi:MAG: phosphoribosyltransferase family protein [Lutibacter sp.]|jgi:pyrimidine operon attenuation protein/uracil phosphoribosyltransferase|nr:phosphoribosyltransferase family protein [Lutibacter sp.]
MERSIILTSEQIEDKTRRMAYQLYETHVKEQVVILAGINGNGYVFAQKLGKCLQGISDIKVVLCKVIIDKKQPLKPVKTDLPVADYQEKCIVLVDDVLNSGATLIYGVKHFLEVPLKQFKTAVLINRNHKRYPVKADFKGLSLSTSLQEHVSVVFEESTAYAVLE